MCHGKIKNRPTVSIALAAYNGRDFIISQINSILPQLKESDELIVSIDPSTDGTEDLLKKTYSHDNRIKLITNPLTPGVVNNFQNALSNTSKDIIFYADQDDIWKENKIDRVLEEFVNTKVTVVFHDCRLIDKEGKLLRPSTFELRGGARTSVFGNLIRLSFIGCAMAFRSSLKPYILPIPTIYRSHDWWTGCIAGCFGKMVAINEPLINHRLHDNNVTPSTRPGISYQLQVRAIILYNLMKRWGKSVLTGARLKQ